MAERRDIDESKDWRERSKQGSSNFRADADEELAARASELSIQDIRVNHGEKFTVSISGQGPPIVVECKAGIEGRYCYIFVNDRRILVHGCPKDLNDVMNGTKDISDVRLPRGWTSERICGPSEGGKYYNYLFLDPRKLQKGREMIFKTFVEAIFYVGEGTNDIKDNIKKQRSYSHFYLNEKKETQLMCDLIMAIRKSGEKTKVAHFFRCDSEDDSCTREACMIKAIGKDRLANNREGSVKDQTLKNNDPAQIRLGVNCLHQAFTKFRDGSAYQYEDDSPGKRSAPSPPAPGKNNSCSAPPHTLGKSHSRSANPTPTHMNPSNSSQKSETDPTKHTHQSHRQSPSKRVNLHKTEFKNM